MVPDDARGARFHGLEATRRRTVLIALEIALAFPLTVGAALLTQTLAQLKSVEKGFDDAAVVQGRITLEGERYRTGEQSITYFNALLARLRGTPGRYVSAGSRPMNPGPRPKYNFVRLYLRS